MAKRKPTLTHEDALTLKEGQIIEALISGVWAKAIVCPLYRAYRWHRWPGGVYGTFTRDSVVGGRVTIRRQGHIIRETNSGRKPFRFPKTTKRLTQLRFCEESLDPIPANVFADWLMDNGFPEAGIALAKAFPFEDGKGNK